MNLILDFGNTNKKLAVFSKGRLLKLEQHLSIRTGIVREVMRRYPGIHHCILASVVNYPVSLRNFLAENFRFFEMDEKTKLPVINKYSTKKTLGKDRIAAAVAGSNLFPGRDVLVVNAGSCITYDFVNSHQEYLGGAISPGLNMRLRALHTFTDKLPLVNLKRYRGLIGNSTGASIKSGVINGATAEIEGVAQRYAKEFPGITVILSGGDLKYFDKRLKISIFAIPNIVIHGLSQILEFNVKKAK